MHVEHVFDLSTVQAEPFAGVPLAHLHLFLWHSSPDAFFTCLNPDLQLLQPVLPFTLHSVPEYAGPLAHRHLFLLQELFHK